MCRCQHWGITEMIPFDFPLAQKKATLEKITQPHQWSCFQKSQLLIPTSLGYQVNPCQNKHGSSPEQNKLPRLSMTLKKWGHCLNSGVMPPFFHGSEGDSTPTTAAIDSRHPPTPRLADHASRVQSAQVAQKLGEAPSRLRVLRNPPFRAPGLSL